jgi:hypothetical protein
MGGTSQIRVRTSRIRDGWVVVEYDPGNPGVIRTRWYDLLDEALADVGRCLLKTGPLARQNKSTSSRAAK